MHPRALVAQREPCHERDWPSVSLPIRHDHHGFILCHSTVKPFIWIVIGGRVLWTSCTILLDGAFSAYRCVRPGKLGSQVSGVSLL